MLETTTRSAVRTPPKDSARRFESDEEAYCFCIRGLYGHRHRRRGLVTAATQRRARAAHRRGAHLQPGPGHRLSPREWAERTLAESMDATGRCLSETTFASSGRVVVPVPGDEPTRQVFFVHKTSPIGWCLRLSATWRRQGGDARRELFDWWAPALSLPQGDGILTEWSRFVS